MFDRIKKYLGLNENVSRDNHLVNSFIIGYDNSRKNVSRDNRLVGAYLSSTLSGSIDELVE